MDLLRWVPLRSVKTRGCDCAGSQGNSSACCSWQRGPWHACIHLVRWEHIASGEAELRPHLYFELSALFGYEEKQQQTEVCFPSFQRTTVRKGELRCQVGGETWQGEMSWQNQEKRHS